MGTLRERLVSAAFSAGWGLVCRIPESWARALFEFGADVAWRRQGAGVQVLEGNLVRVLRTSAGDSLTPSEFGAELRALSRDVMRSYARYYLETFRLQTIPDERILSGMHINMEQLDRTLEHMRGGRGVIYALPHMGDFEQAGRWVILAGAGSIVAPVERLKPEAVFQMFLKFRQGLGMEIVPTSGGAQAFGVMAQRLRAGKLVTIVADRDLSDTGVEVDFFGEKALFPAGPAALAVQTGAALMPVACWFVGQDEWGAHIYDEIPVPADGDRRQKVAAMTQAMVRVFEQGISEHPEDWHMLQRVFVNDLDPQRIARSRARAGHGNGRAAALAAAEPSVPPSVGAPDTMAEPSGAQRGVRGVVPPEDGRAPGTPS